MPVRMTWPQYLRGECQVDGFTIKLTDHETELLLLLMIRCPGQISVSEIIEWLWHDPRFEPRTVEHRAQGTVRRLRAKIGEFRIATRINFGYRLIQEPPSKRGRARGKRGPEIRGGINSARTPDLQAVV